MTGTESTDERPDRSHIGLVVLVVLAGLASILMLISGSDAALKIALLAALWAAVLGFFMVARYRNEAAARGRELERIKAEQAAQAERAGAASAGADAELFASIKEELAAIRGQLDELAGREYTYEPAALYAQARRIAELESTGLSGYADYAAEEPQVTFTQASGGAPSADAIAGRLGSQPTSPRQDNPLADIIREREEVSPESTFDTGTFQAVDWAAGGLDETPAAQQSVAEPSAETWAADEPAAAQPAEEPAADARHGRRRSDAGRAGTKSVAELMAELKKGK